MRSTNSPKAPGCRLDPTPLASYERIDTLVSTTAVITQQTRDCLFASGHRKAWLVGGFALLALLLGVVGLYGVVAYSVSRRTREIGVRMAVGAQRSSVYRLIMKGAVRLTACGIAGGLVCSVGVATVIRDLLFRVRSWDMETLGVVTAVRATSALLACYIPARRAAQVDPMVALRYE